MLEIAAPSWPLPPTSRTACEPPWPFSSSPPFSSGRPRIESPRFRQRLERVPILDVPVWVDDDRFNLRYHVRHTSLPRPVSLRQLERLAARVLSRRLDRSKPLWEFWFAEKL
jgi:diacylglycerol O-acyltransferase